MRIFEARFRAGFFYSSLEKQIPNNALQLLDNIIYESAVDSFQELSGPTQENLATRTPPKTRALCLLAEAS